MKNPEGFLEPVLFPISHALRSIPFLSKLDSEALNALATHCMSVRYRTGEPVVSALDRGAMILFILDGLAKLVGATLEGPERIIYIYKPGDVIGARFFQKSLEDEYAVVAMDDLRVLRISREAFMAVAQDHPQILVGLNEVFAERILRMSANLFAALSDSGIVRLSKILNDFCAGDGEPLDAFVPMDYQLTHEELGQIAGLSRPHTTTLLGDLEMMGALSRRERGKLLLRRDKLRDLMHRDTSSTGMDAQW